jgi:hypothetical protein
MTNAEADVGNVGLRIFAGTLAGVGRHALEPGEALFTMKGLRAARRD